MGSGRVRSRVASLRQGYVPTAITADWRVPADGVTADRDTEAATVSSDETG
jgi:hypothetical protein